MAKKKINPYELTSKVAKFVKKSLPIIVIASSILLAKGSDIKKSKK